MAAVSVGGSPGRAAKLPNAPDEEDGLRCEELGKPVKERDEEEKEEGYCDWG